MEAVDVRRLGWNSSSSSSSGGDDDAVAAMYQDTVISKNIIAMQEMFVVDAGRSVGRQVDSTKEITAA